MKAELVKKTSGKGGCAAVFPVVVVLVLAALAGARQAAAQPAEEPSPGAPEEPGPPTVPDEQGPRERAKELLRQGDIAYRLQKFEEALGLYQEAFKLVDHPAFLFNVAQAFRQLNRTEQALFYYKLFLSDWRMKLPGQPVPYEGEVHGHIRRLEQVLADKKREKKLPAGLAPVLRGTLTLEGVARGDRVYLDGKLLSPGKETGNYEVAAGAHRVRVEADGFSTWDGDVTVGANAQRRTSVELQVWDMRTPLLMTSLGLTAVAGCFLGMGIAYNQQHNQYILETPEADDARELSTVGYAVAGATAALAATSWTLYLLHRRGVSRAEDRLKPPAGPTATLGVGPTGRGGAVVGAVRW